MPFFVTAAALVAAPIVQAIPAQAVAETDATRVARAWLMLVDQQAWVESWQASGDAFRARLTADQWAQMMQAVRVPLGAANNRQLLAVRENVTPPNAPPGNYQLLQFKTDFAQKPGGFEIVALVQQGDAWKVVGYFIR